MDNIIDGSEIAHKVRQKLRAEIQELRIVGIIPGLAAVLVGEDPASAVYVRNKARACDEVGIYSELHHLRSNATQGEVLSLVKALNRESKVHGILVQLPLPKHLNEDSILDSVSPQKDVDGLHPLNQGLLQLGRTSLIPCTPLGVVELLHGSGVSVEGAHVVIVGRSRLVGMPLAILLAQKSARGNATVTLCHSKSNGLSAITRQADILVAAIGKPGFISAEMVKKGAIVIDVGINRIADPSSRRGQRLVGDVDFEKVQPLARMITPVPGGVGPMTIAMLLQNTVTAAKTICASSSTG